jgi:transposase
MRIPPPAFPLRRSRPMPWRPLSDAEWETLSACLRRGPGKPRGRPPADARRLWDGIFWVASSRGPWRDLPAEFGRADTAHRALRRAAASGALHRMLLRVSDHPLFAGDALRGIEWFVVRAYRRAFRITPHAIAYARRLGLASALPCEPCWLLTPTAAAAGAAVPVPPRRRRAAPLADDRVAACQPPASNSFTKTGTASSSSRTPTHSRGVCAVPMSPGPSTRLGAMACNSLASVP